MLDEHITYVHIDIEPFVGVCFVGLLESWTLTVPQLAAGEDA